MLVMQCAQSGFGPACFDYRLRPFLDPCVETFVFPHFGMELEREDIRAAPECLMLIDMT